MEERQFDVLIVGLGIAGSLLGFELGKRNISFRVVDKGGPYNTSAMSSGLINPITGRRFVKSWMIDDLIPCAKEMYHSLEDLLGRKIVFDVTILRHLSSIREENLWLSKAESADVGGYMCAETGLFNLDDVFHSCNTFGHVKGGLRIEGEALIKEYRKYLTDRALLHEDVFEHKALRQEEQGFYYQGWRFSKIIFAEGWKVRNNPYFNDLPFRPAKG